jgi:hypothetical protein
LSKTDYFRLTLVRIVILVFWYLGTLGSDCNHIPVPVFEERRGDQALVLAGYVCKLCAKPLPLFQSYPGIPGDDVCVYLPREFQRLTRFAPWPILPPPEPLQLLP